MVVTALETGQDGEIERIPTNVWDPETDIGTDNPLGKVPALLTDEGALLCDSPLICAYLDSRHDGPRLIPPEGPERWQALNLQALGDGILDAAVARLVEMRMRPAERRWDSWLTRQSAKISRTLDLLEGRAGSDGLDGPPTLGSITVACALGYLDFRFADDHWREGRPALTAWYETFSQRPAMQATVPKDA